jgi:hypothetical protein
VKNFVFVICENYWYFFGRPVKGEDGFLTLEEYWDLRNYEGDGIPGLVSGTSKAKLLIKHDDPSDRITIPMSSVIAICDSKNPADMGYT